MQVKFIEASGASHSVEAELGTTLMNAAVQNGVPGIDGDCGGNAACGTCHVFIDQEWHHLVKVPSGDHERSMLEVLEGVQENSRLSCQVILGDSMDGIIVRLPAAQF